MSGLAHFARSRFARRLTAGLLAFAVLMHLMAMQIGNQHQAARLLAGAAGASPLALLNQICTSNGLVSLDHQAASETALDAQVTHDDSHTSHHFEKPCPFCSSATLTPALFAIAASFFLPLAPESAAPLVYLATPHSLSPDLRHAPLRAPPVHA